MDPDLIAQSWIGTPERGAGSFTAWWRACLEAKVYVPAKGMPGMYEFDPDQWPVAQDMLKNGTDAYTAQSARYAAIKAAEQAEKDASNITCLWHRQKLQDGRHIDDSPCRRPAAGKALQQTSETAARPGGRSA
jgi:hypothetical protein